MHLTSGANNYHLGLLTERLPQEVIAETLTRFDAWEQREKKLNMMNISEIAPGSS